MTWSGLSYQKIIKNRRKELVFGLFGVGLIGALLFKPLNWSSKIYDDLPEGNQVREASLFVDENLGGSLPLDITIDKDDEFWVSPEALNKLSKLVEDVRQVSEVGSALSMADFLKMTNSENQIPDNQVKVKEKLFLYGTSEDNPIDYYLSPDRSETRVSIFFKDEQSVQVSNAIAQVKTLAEKSFPDAKIVVSGNAWSTHLINREISQRLLYGFFNALLFIFLVILILFRSLSWSLVAILPNLIPPMILLTVLALSQTSIKPSIAMVFSISLGIAFDNTIYILLSLKGDWLIDL